MPLGLALFLLSWCALISGEVDVAKPAAAKLDCAAEPAKYVKLAAGSEGVNPKLPEWLPYNWFLIVLAMMMGLGKGGVPGSSTSSVALNALYAPDGPGCMDASVALGVPVTVLADLAVVGNYVHKARWEIIMRLLPACGLGIALGTQLMGKLSPAQAKLLIGSILCGILLLNLSQELKAKAPPKTNGEKDGKEKDKNGKGNDTEEDDGVPAYAKTLWFTSIVGVIGGFATILTNSMGPMLNVFLLTLKLDPQVFVGTRATLFTVVNFLKIGQRIYLGSLAMDMLTLGLKQGVVSIAGVFLSKLIVKRMSKSLFMKMEYTLMSYASLKLLDAGLALGFLN